MSGETSGQYQLRKLERRLELLAAHQREMEARLWTLEDSRVFRILQRMATFTGSIRARTRKVVIPETDAAARKQAYRAWVEQRTPVGSDISSLAFQPRFHVLEGGAGGGTEGADYVILTASGGRPTPNALFDLASAVQTERYEVLYGDEDHDSGPLLKPAWSPELLASPRYLGGSLVVRADVFVAAGPYADLAELARNLARCKARFHHIPRMLARFEQPVPEPVASQPKKVAGTPLASIVICSRNAGLLKSCLDSIEHKTAYGHREIVVVEHVAPGKQLLPGTPYTRVGYFGRFDFAAMNNLGVKAAKGEILVFLNDDVQPLTSGWLEALVAQAQRPEVGAVGALLLFPDGSIQHAGVVIGMGGYAGHPGHAKFDGGFFPWLTVTRNVSAVTGACLAMRREVFDKLGGFDPIFPVNYNDVDLCLRALEAGYQVIFEASARLTHFESRTRTRGMNWDEADVFAERWSERIAQGDPYYNPNLSLRNENCELQECSR